MQTACRPNRPRWANWSRREQVKSIQLNGRNPLYLSQLEPGVTRNAPMSSFNFSLDNTLYVNGSRSQENLLALDGAPMVRTRSNNNSVGVADVDSTSQVQILTTGYQAEYGRTSGGQVRIIPKSGTSNYHGGRLRISAELVLQCEHLDAQERRHRSRDRRVIRRLSATTSSAGT